MRDEGQVKPQSRRGDMDLWKWEPVPLDDRSEDTIKGPVHPM